MYLKAAKELVHIRTWLACVDDLMQEAGDSLMMKLGEAAPLAWRLRSFSPAMPQSYQTE